MAINKHSCGKYQVKVTGIDGRWITKLFESYKDAEVFETDLKIKTGQLDPQTGLDLLIAEI